ncbi:hypothetical protein HY635_01600 [Candidatus Uhrbacteria bacterium]|nr:hypothetical protein [Candidatus Uhrbacteria bacterium]
MRSLDTPDEYRQLLAELFGDRPRTRWVFGEPTDAPGFDAELVARSDFDISDFNAAEHTVAVVGLFPILAMVYETTVLEDVQAQLVSPFFDQLRACFRYRTSFASSPKLGALMDALQATLRRRASDHRIAYANNGHTIDVHWPLRRGDRVVQLIIGREPIPDRIPKA